MHLNVSGGIYGDCAALIIDFVPGTLTQIQFYAEAPSVKSQANTVLLHAISEHCSG